MKRALKSLVYLKLLSSVSSFHYLSLASAGGGSRSMLTRLTRSREHATSPAQPSVSGESDQIIKSKKRKRKTTTDMEELRQILKKTSEIDSKNAQLYSAKTNSSSLSRHNIEVDIGDLIPCRIIARPSKSIKSPYVADVLPLIGSESERSIALAHAPGLDCCHIVLPNSIVYCSLAANSKAKTAYTIKLCQDRVDGFDERVDEKDRTYTIVGYHPALAETLTKEFLTSPTFRAPLLQQFSQFQHTDHLTLLNSMLCTGQVTIGDSRVDYLLSLPASASPTGISPKVLIEVKNVVCAEYEADNIPNNKGKNKVQFSRLKEDIEIVQISPRASNNSGKNVIKPKKCALFATGKRKPGTGVVSARAIKHIHNIISLCNDPHEQYHGMIVFIVNRSDCDAFRPCHEACMLFAQSLYLASLHPRIELLAVEVQYESKEMGEKKNFVAKITRQLPIVTVREVMEQAIDPLHLEKVLQSAGVEEKQI